MSKYKIPVTIYTIAQKTIGFVECANVEEYNEKAADLWESIGFETPTTNCTNNFDLNDWDISPIDEDELRFYEDK